MITPPIFNRDNEPIDSVDAWETRASPGKVRWANGYSAKALAEAWVDDRGPAALLDLLRGDEAFEGIRFERVTAEAQTHFDGFGGPRNHDLLIEASDGHGKVTIGLEGKVNERFGLTVDQRLNAADRKENAGEPTNAPARIQGLLACLAGADLDHAPELGALRYQLFSATAGTMAAAKERGSVRAAFVVQGLTTPRADPKAQRENAEDLARFIEVVFGLDCPTRNSWLIGPVRAREGTDRIQDDVDLWFGHLVTA